MISLSLFQLRAWRGSRQSGVCSRGRRRSARWAGSSILVLSAFSHLQSFSKYFDLSVVKGRQAHWHPKVNMPRAFHLLIYLLLKLRKKIIFSHLTFWKRYFSICSLLKTIFPQICDSEKDIPKLSVEINKKYLLLLFDQKIFCRQRKFENFNQVEW